MNGLKQRIIGALVLISLVVIFVPMLFDEPHSERSSREINIPEEPPFPGVDSPQPKDTEIPSYRMEDPAETATVSPQPVPDAKPSTDSAPPPVAEPAPIAEPVPSQQAKTEQKTQPMPEAKPESKSKSESAKASSGDSGKADYSRSLEGAWVVQLGSFGNADNARRLRDSVREKGYGSHLQEIPRGDTTLTRVFSGPFADKAEAERAKKALDSAFDLNSLVTSNDS